jgi:hypothetical protein
MEDSMSSRRIVSLAVAAAILAAALPAAAEPATPADARLRASIDRALAAPGPSAAPSSAPQATSSKVRKAQSGATSNGSGGGGGGKMILALLGTAISVGATYLIVKEMQKQTEPLPPAFRAR